MFFIENFDLCGVGNIFAASVTDYFFQSNVAGQAIVVILLVMSVLAWAVMFCKYSDLTSMSSMNNETSQKISKSGLIDAAGTKTLKGPYAALLRESVNAWARCGMGSDPTVRAARALFVENALQRTLARQIAKYESKMTLLGTIISGAPFMGLLGTVWGVMDCFGSMSAQASVTLQNLAPGVAGALLTTVAGLLVAIPSLFGLNLLTTRARDMITDLESFASLLADKIEIESESRAEGDRPSVKAAAPASKLKETVVEKTPAGSPKVISFTLDDDDDSPTPPRNFDE